MLLKILRKDLLRRKGVNLILFLFITLATVFLASSLNNIVVVSSAVSYFMDYAKVPEVSMIVSGEDEKEKMDSFLEEDSKYAKKYQYNRYLNAGERDIHILKDKKSIKFDGKGSELYMAVQNVDYCKVFDQDGNAFTLEEGEIAIKNSLMTQNNLKEGDTIRITAGSVTKEFTVKTTMKDAAFGSDVVGTSRLMISQEDFDDFDGQTSQICVYYIASDDENKLTKELNEQGFTTLVNLIKKSTYQMAYSFDMMMAGLLILIGICLILIALLVLRFTLVFTLEEDYSEIGIMKALGFREFFIKKIYLVKYFAIVTTGALLGLLLSIPIGTLMIKSVSTNMVMESSDANLFYNISSALAVVVLVMLFCYLCTRKLNKVSAITAIRGGHTGERYTKRRGILLHRRKKAPVPFYLGVNDILNHMKRYMVLVITFCISFILISIPVNTLNTLESREMVGKFYLNPESSVYVSRIEGKGENKYANKAEVGSGLERLEQELEEAGYEADLTATLIYFPQIKESKGEAGIRILSTQLMGENKEFGEYSKGSAPRLANEIAFSKAIMEENEWQIGDSVYALINGKEEKLWITGIYSDYMQLGRSARLSPETDFSKDNIFDYWSIMLDIDTDLSQEELAEELQKKFPDYEWKHAQEMIDQNVGGIREPMKDIIPSMTAMLCGIIMLITMLMEKLFIVREKGEIAMMKSVGFRNKSIQAWQILRMICVVLVSLILSVPLSLLSNKFVLKPIFGVMGADVQIQVVPWQVYGLYPGILLVCIILAAILATRTIKKINIRELNNLE